MSAPSTAPKYSFGLLAVGAVIIALGAAQEFYTQNSGTDPAKIIQDSNIQIGGDKRAESNKYEYFKVTRVVDGDTLQIDMHGTKEKVRLIGINTPETVDPRRAVQCFGKEASDRMKSLADGNLVRLESDPTQSFRDTYDRLLAYVYLEDGQMLNRKMIAEGYAYEYTYGVPYKYQKEFRDLVALARTSERGLWSPSTCNGKK